MVAQWFHFRLVASTGNSFDNGRFTMSNMPRRKKSGLKTYRAKRRFGVTAEPKGKVARKRGNAFVIQKHAARRLHYDLRLELDGVMKSWAVTRGPSLVPGDKRLAVQVEDHPIAYNKFEGTIPQGEYGGGTVMIWDRGRWHPENDPHKGLEKGHLAFTLDGDKLHGGWHLVRMHRRPGEKRDNWLLIKQHDEAERSARDKDILEEEPLSVVTGRTMDEIASGPKREWRTNKKKTATPPPRKAKIASHGRARAAVIGAIRKSGAVAGTNAVANAPKGRLPGFVPPCLATLSDKPPDSGNWVHEIKFDGYRIQARLDRGKVKLLTRKGLDWTTKFPSVASAVAKLPATSALIDGEVVVEDADGISSFSLLQQDLKDKRDDRMVYYAFDVLHLSGGNLERLPLTERKNALATLLKRQPTRGHVRLSESLRERGSTLLRHACKMGLEGIISKLADAPYHSGRGYDWVKTKCSDRQEFVVAGMVPSTADARAVGALVLGLYGDGGSLHYAGRTGTGFTREVARSLFKKLKSIETSRPPFETIPAEERGARKPLWVDPKLVVEVDFHGWTHSDRVRQGSFQGIREDKAAKDVVREKSAAAASRPAIVKREPIKKKNDVSVAGVRLTHPDRVYWEDVGVTKRHLAEFYVQIWKWMRPHLVGRPISLVRCPEGASGQCFFQKHARAGIPTEHLHLVPEKGDKIISVDDIDGVVALVQGGVLEIHTRGTTIDQRENADRLVFDLDPGPGTSWKDVVAAAIDVRKRLEGIKLKSFVKTSGGKGLHVVLPIAPTPWEQVKVFTKAVAEAMEADEPDRYVSTATKAKRNKRIFVDYLRNSREATAIAPYSTRARAGAPVSVPIDWAELSSLKSADQYTVQNLLQRLSKRRTDPWASIGRVRQALPKLK
jgi:bifunctional non-homologous end joining protein LigD